MSARLRTLVHGVLAIFVGLLGLTVLSAAPAAAVGTASLSGTLTTGGAPAVDGHVSASVYNADFGFYSFAGYTAVDASGDWSFPDLEAGAYQLYFSAGDAYVSEYWDDALSEDNADDITLADGGSVSDLDADLAEAGSIAGTVTDTVGPLADVQVSAYTYNAAEDFWEYQGGAFTEPDGTYSITGLAPDSYHVGFDGTDDGFVKEFYNDQPDVESGDDVDVTGGTTETANAELGVGASISGTVSWPTVDPDNTACVTAYAVLDGGNPDYVSEDCTVNDGTYTIGGLAAGTYRLQFSPSDDYVEEWWNDKADFGTANDVVLGAHEAATGKDAVLAAASHLTGTVTNAAHAGVGSAYVEAYRLVAGDWDYVGDASTNASGQFDIGGLAAGTYALGYYPDDTYLREFYDNQPSLSAATPIVLATGETKTGLDAELATGAHLVGTVTKTGGGALEDVEVSAYRMVDGDWDSVDSAQTDAAGHYDIDQLQPGTYRLRIDGRDGGFSQEYWDNQPTLDAANDIDVAAGATVTSDAVLDKLGSIAGTVTAAGPPALGEVCVRAWYYNAINDYWDWDRQDCTPGSYKITGLEPNDYRLQFVEFSGNHVTEWWDDKPTRALADSIPVALGVDVTGKNAELAAASHITGRVTNTGGTGIKNVDVEAYTLVDGDWESVAQDSTSSTGDYDIGSLTGGTYRLQFNSDGAYIGEWWNNQPTLQTATDISVPVSGTASGRDAVLDLGATVSGTVTGPTSLPLPGVDVSLFKLVPGEGYQSFSYDGTAANGTFSIGALPTGSYKIGYSRFGYADEWWNDQPTLASGAVIDIVAGTTYPGKNAQLEVASSIAGTVTNPVGGAAPGVAVTAYIQRSGYWEFADSAIVGSDGTYKIEDLQQGTYALRFRGGDFLTEYWNDKPSLDAADTFAVGRSTDVTGKNAQLALAGHITGTVTKAGGAPFPDGYVEAWGLVDGDWDYVTDADTSATGAYDLGGLPTGTYKVRFYGSGQYAGEWWDNKPTLSSADGIAVTAGSTTSGKNAELAIGSHITGTVTNTAAAGLTGISVYAYLVDGSDLAYAGYDETNGSGAYDLSGLSAGTYKLQFTDEYNSNPYAPEWFDDKLTSSAATAVVVPATTTVSGKNATLVAGAHVTGTVTGPSSTPLNDVFVSAYRLVDGDYEYEAGRYTNASGNYDVRGLPAGTYKIGFEDDNGTYDVEYWNDATSLPTATPINVTASGTVANINAQLGSTASPAVTPGTPTVSGTPQVGSLLTANPGTWAPLPVSFTYEWLADNVVISGANASTFTPTTAQQGATIKVRVTGSKPGYTSTTATSAGVGPVAPAPTPTVTAGTPSVSGIPQVGSQLTANPGTWAPLPVSFAYEWLADDVVISGANASTFTPTAAQLGATIKVRVTGSKPGYTSSTATSAGVGPVTDASTPAVTAGTPTVSGTPQVGSLLTANPGTWAPLPVSFTYEWLADDVVISGANASTFTPTAAQQGATIKVRVTGSKPGYTSASATSAGVGPVAPAATPAVTPGTPTVSGTAKVGSTVTASAGSWGPAPVSLAYQWLSNGAPIAGATGTTYAVPAGQVGRQLSVRVTGSKAGYSPATATSAATSKVAPGTITVLKKPKIKGKGQVGKTLTLKPGGYAPAGVKVTIQWYANGKKIKKATGSSLALTKKQAGKSVTAKVTLTLAGYTTVVVETKAKKVT